MFLSRIMTLLLLLAAATAGAALDPARLVTTHGREFQRNGSAFRFMGVNMRGFTQYGAGTSGPLQYAPLSYQDDNLNGLQAMNARVVRIFAANRFDTNAANITRLQNALDKIEAKNMYAIVVLTDFYPSGYNPAGDNGYYTQSGTYLNGTWFATDYTINYKPWVQSVVTALKDHNAIFAWEVGNELTDLAVPANIMPFMADIAATIKGIDPNHMVTTGAISVDHMQLSIDQGVTLYSDPNIDFLTTHVYTDENPENIFLAKNWAVQCRVEKPLIMEEFGWDRTVPTLATKVQNAVDFWFDTRQVQGFMQWGYQVGTVDLGDGDLSVGMDDIHPTYPNYTTLFNIYKPRADAEAAGPPALESIADPPGANVAQGRATQTSTNYNASNAGDKAVDGVISASSKWTSNGSALPQWISIDLGATQSITGFVIHTASSAEDAHYGLQSFRLQTGTSMSGPWTTLATVSNPGQFARVRHVEPAPVAARYVRIEVLDAGIDNYVRLPEVEVYAASGVEAWQVY